MTWPSLGGGVRSKPRLATCSVAAFPTDNKAGRQDEMEMRGHEHQARALFSQLPYARKLQPLRDRAHSRVDCEALLLELAAFVVEALERQREDLDELVLLEFGLQILILGFGQVDLDVHNVEVCVAKSRICRGSAPDDLDVQYVDCASMMGKLIERI